jgi:hypothetical protein
MVSIEQWHEVREVSPTGNIIAVLISVPQKWHRWVERDENCLKH